LGKKNEPAVHHAPPSFDVGKGIVVKGGKDVCVLSTGNVLPIAVEAAVNLEKIGISAQVVSMHTVKPLDLELLSNAFDGFDVIATIEEHSLIGGFGGSIAEWLADQPFPKRKLCRIGISDDFIHGAGDQTHARMVLGLTADNIAQKIAACLSQKSGETFFLPKADDESSR
jgi:transketolase